ncbi:MAG TPA: uroporphyrinogen-III synthase [Candidatus Binatia bacterium]|jgi:uroporphyrinogen-III synthase
MESSPQTGLKGLRVVSFESRREREMAELIQRYGGEAIVAPSMREVPLEQNTAALDFMRELKAGKIDIVIFLTGVGARTLIDAIATAYPREEFAQALKSVKLVARGPKPVGALKEIGVAVDVAIPEPNTWREILTELKKTGDLRGRRVAVQEYGVTRQELIDGLRSLGADILSVPVYRWVLPEDTGPLKSAARTIAEGRADVVLFTNAKQVDHLFEVAAADGLGDKLRTALQSIVVASIGPVCTEALERHGLHAGVEPEHPKMGHLIAAVANRARGLLETKRKK